MHKATEAAIRPPSVRIVRNERLWWYRLARPYYWLLIEIGYLSLYAEIFNSYYRFNWHIKDYIIIRSLYI